MAHKRERRHLDVAIIGAGISGLYSAWRLLQEDPHLKIRIFEQGERVGGRLLTVDLLPAGARRAELGGMRFTDDQRLVRNLVDSLRKDPHSGSTFRQDLEMKDFTFETKMLFLRETRVVSPQALPSRLYKLRDRSQSLSNVAVTVAKRGILTALDLILHEPASNSHRYGDYTKQLLQQLGKNTLSADAWREWQASATINGIHLFNIGFWNLMHRCLKPDEFLFLHDAIGYESLLANSNAAQAIPVFLGDFDVKKYWTLKGGMETLPRALASLLEKHSTAATSLSASLTAVKLQADGFELRIEDSHKRTSTLWNAKTVILALPKSSLERLEFVEFGRHSAAIENFRNHDLKQVTAHPAFKMFLTYDDAWWYEEFGLAARAITDLPIRQVYYFADRPNAKAFVMASYSDDHYVDFWSPLVNDPILKEAERRNHMASARIRMKAHEQLQTMHDRQLPLPTGGRVKEWKEAWHFWNVHARPWDATARMVRPISELNLFTCGEAFSLEQGWIEGALKSAERVLAAIGIAAPTGIKDYDQYVKA